MSVSTPVKYKRESQVRVGTGSLNIRKRRNRKQLTHNVFSCALGCASGCAVQIGLLEGSVERSGGGRGRLPGEHSAVLAEFYRHRGRHL